MIYLASPYTHPDPAVREERFQQACRAAAALVNAGHVVFAPIVHSHPIAAYGLPTTWAFWRQQDQAFLERCDELVVLMLDGWRQSAGVQGEIGLAQELGKPTRFLEPGLTVPHGSPPLAAGASSVPDWPGGRPTTRGPAWGPRGRTGGEDSASRGGRTGRGRSS